MFEITDEEFQNLTTFVKVNYGLDLTSKRMFAQMRMQKLIAENGFDCFADYFQYVCSDLTGHAVTGLINGLTVNYTLFYRESFHFEYLAQEVLPRLFAKEQQTKDLRIWSAGCSTGEEPYTLAIILADFLGMYKTQWDTKVLATDISTFALKKALVGAYPAASIEGLNPEWVRKYFTREPNDPENIYVAPSIKEEIIFRKHNMVVDPFIFKQKFHAIFCRNVMIYFDEETKYRVLRKFFDNLDDDGYLFIGMSETIDLAKSGFAYAMPSVYQKVKG